MTRTRITLEDLVEMQRFDQLRGDIEERVHAAIRPVLARADRALWELENPRTIPGRHSDDFSVFWNLANPRMRRP